MPVSTVFQQIFVASTLEAAILDTLQMWFNTYLSEIERQLGVTAQSVPRPTHYTNRNSFDALPGETLPKVVVISPGTTGAPIKDGSKQYRALWRLGVGVANVHKDEATANMLAKIYGAAVRAILTQQSNGVGRAEWVEESYPDIPTADALVIYKASNVWFTIDVENTVRQQGGPSVPDLPPASYSYGQVDSVIIDLQKLAVS
jgi:hypothetical protein